MSNQKRITGDAPTIIRSVLSWVVDPDATRHCAITGGAGAGKTTMIKDLIAQFNMMAGLGMLDTDIIGHTSNEYIRPCSASNDSCDVLAKDLNVLNQQVPTLHKMFDIKVTKAGPYFYMGHNTKVFHKDIWMTTSKFSSTSPYSKYYICDEGNYVTGDVIDLIEAKDPEARIIFVGSKHQLSMGSGQSDIFNRGYYEFLLNTKWRAANQEVQSVYDITESDVINKTHTELPANNSLQYMDEDTWLQTMESAYKNTTGLRVCTLAYSNKRVFHLLNTIRDMKGLPRDKPYDMDRDIQCLFRGSSVYIPKNNPSILADDNNEHYIRIPYKGGKSFRSYVANDLQEYHYLRQAENQTRQDETYPSLLGSTEAKTISGSQGSTYDIVFLDLRDLHNTIYKYDMEQFRRLRHVGMSRHKQAIYILV